MENKVMVTGAAGLIGSYLVERLLELVNKVYGFVTADLSVNNNLENVKNHNNFIYFQGDIAYVVEQSEGSGISIWDLSSGDVIDRWRGIPEVCEAAHGCALDSEGNIYIAEIGLGNVGQRIRKLNKI